MGQIKKEAPLKLKNRPFIRTFSEFEWGGLVLAKIDFPIFSKNKPPKSSNFECPLKKKGSIK